MMHQWKLSWPGNFCLRCGIDDPLELAWAGVIEGALIDCWDCQGGMERYQPCAACGGMGVVLDPNFKIPPCIPEEPVVKS